MVFALVILSFACTYLAGQVLILSVDGSMKETVANVQEYVRFRQKGLPICQKSPQSSGNAKPLGIQLRFIDSHAYVLELLCTQFEGFPQQIGAGSLPRFVTKVPGSSGLAYMYDNPKRTEFSLRSFFSTRSFSFGSEYFADARLTRAIPQTSCAGYGYSCCDATIERTDGQVQREGVIDCPSGCATSCQSRPHFLSFSSDPYANYSRVIEMDAGSFPVTFEYNAELLGGRIARVSISYGDGSSDESVSSQGSFSHTFLCDGVCRYTVSITAYDAQGNSSLASDSTTLYIERR